MGKIKTGLISIVFWGVLLAPGFKYIGEAYETYCSIYEQTSENTQTIYPRDLSAEYACANKNLLYGGILSLIGTASLVFGAIYAQLPEREITRKPKPMKFTRKRTYSDQDGFNPEFRKNIYED